MSLSGHCAIAGVYEHPTRWAPDESEDQIMAECARGALEDAGLTLDDVDYGAVEPVSPQASSRLFCSAMASASASGFGSPVASTPTWWNWRLRPACGRS